MTADPAFDTPDYTATTARLDVADAAVIHAAGCTDPWCCDCRPLAAHLDRATRQLAMLTPTAEPDPLF